MKSKLHTGRQYLQNVSDKGLMYIMHTELNNKKTKQPNLKMRKILQSHSHWQYGTGTKTEI